MLKLFSIFDKKAAAYLTPFFSATSGTASRDIHQAVSNTESPFHKFAADYALYEFGSFDQTSGIFVIHNEPQLVAELSTFKEIS